MIKAEQASKQKAVRMAAPIAGTIPASLKAIRPFVIIHSQLEKKDPTVAYFGELARLDVRV